jgi:hypothetical protein
MHPIKHSLTRLWTNTATIQEGDLCEERAACVRTSTSKRTSERAKLVSQSQTLLQCECVRRRSVQFARSLDPRVPLRISCCVFLVLSGGARCWDYRQAYHVVFPPRDQTPHQPFSETRPSFCPQNEPTLQSELFF